mmetsp:Transcript_27129/g.59093  ORF Transcript_27129/g.59093 Transcript_27129/m.59093 type:complete len:202 (-) Transcript_27129:1965-2570(-)
MPPSAMSPAPHSGKQSPLPCSKRHRALQGVALGVGRRSLRSVPGPQRRGRGESYPHKAPMARRRFRRWRLAIVAANGPRLRGPGGPRPRGLRFHGGPRACRCLAPNEVPQDLSARLRRPMGRRGQASQPCRRQAAGPDQQAKAPLQWGASRHPNLPTAGTNPLMPAHPRLPPVTAPRAGCKAARPPPTIARVRPRPPSPAP